MVKTSALIVIDVQNDFCSGGMLAVSGGDLIVPIINRLVAQFPQVIATRDWHPPGHISFASAHAGKSVGDTVSTPTGTQRLWPDHCIAGSAGAAFHPRLDIAPVQMILHKGADPQLDSYSAFFASDGTTQTGLAAYLHAHNMVDLYLCGLATDVCVLHTAIDALKLDLRVTIVTDAVAAVAAGAAALADMATRGARLLDSATILGVAA